MNTYLDCIPCALRQALDAARLITDDERIHEQIVREILKITADLDLNRPPPWIGQIIHRRLRALSGVADPYRSLKSQFNRLAMAVLPELKACIEQGPEPLIAAAKYAIAGNVIDFGVKSSLDEHEVARSLRDSGSTATYGDWAEFKRHMERAKEILYLADNAGEIALDRLLIEELGPERVTLVVRGSAVINDATLEDVLEVGLSGLVRTMDNGSDAPGTILEDCSPAFREKFHTAEVIIAKGQGNFETLNDVKTNIFFLMKVKCPVIARHVGLPIGAQAVIHSNG
ncbi:DUF89 family protein [bacterium]|nr:DUF89 family protein [bacterium]